MILGIDHYIGWLHIAKDDRFGFVRMQILKYVTQLESPANNPLFCQKIVCAIDNNFQIRAGYILQHQIRTFVDGEIIINAWNGAMIQRGQQIGFTLEIAYDGTAHYRIHSAVDHFLHRHDFGNIWKMQVACPVDSAHTANAKHTLDQIPFFQGDTGLKLLAGILICVWIKALRDTVGFHYAPFPL